MAEIDEPVRQEPLQVPAPWRYPAPIKEPSPGIPAPVKTFVADNQGVRIVYRYTGIIDMYACEHEWAMKIVESGNFWKFDEGLVAHVTIFDNVRECAKCGLYTLYGWRDNNLYCETNARYVE